MTVSFWRKVPRSKRRPICWRTMAAAVVALSTSETSLTSSALMRSLTTVREARTPLRRVLKKKSSGCWRKRSCQAFWAVRTERGQLPKLPLLIRATFGWWCENSSWISGSEMGWGSRGFLGWRWLGSSAPFRGSSWWFMVGLGC